MSKTTQTEAQKPDVGPETESGNPVAEEVVGEVEIAEDQVTVTDGEPLVNSKVKGKKTKKRAPVFLPVGALDADTDDKTPKTTKTSSRGRKVAGDGRKPRKSAKKTPSEGKGQKKSKRKAKNLSPEMTIGELAENYLAHLEDEGKGHGTLFSYGIELKMACRELGAGTKVSSLTTKKVRNYFESDSVTRNRKGKPKAKPTVDKSRRVFRLALTWLEEIGVLAKAPVPDMKEKGSK